MANISHRVIPLVLSLLAGTNLQAGSLNVRPGSGPGGSPVSLAASGFDENYNTAFYLVGTFGNQLVGACPPDNRANCTLQIAQLQAYAPGEVTLEARNSLGQSGQDTFEIAPPRLEMSPRCGAPGSTITLTGRFFPLGVAAGVEFGGSFIPASAGNHPTGFSFDFSFPAPALPPGRYPVRVFNSVGSSITQAFLLDTTCDIVGEVTRVDGDGLVATGPGRPPGGEPLGVGDPLRMTDIITSTGTGGGQLKFIDNTTWDMRKDSVLAVEDFTYEPQTSIGASFFSLLQGVFVHKGGDTTGGPGGSEHGDLVKPYGAIGIRGTDFALKEVPGSDTQEVYLTDGQIAVTPFGTGLPQVYDAPVALTFTASAITSGPIVDLDADGVPDPVDNCQDVANASQCDSDGDGYGNRCDADLNDNGAVNAQDTTLFRQQLGQPSAAPSFNEADLNCNGAVNAQDTTLFRQRLGLPPGPSGLSP